MTDTDHCIKEPEGVTAHNQQNVFQTYNNTHDNPISGEDNTSMAPESPELLPPRSIGIFGEAAMRQRSKNTVALHGWPILSDSDDLAEPLLNDQGSESDCKDVLPLPHSKVSLQEVPQGIDILSGYSSEELDKEWVPAVKSREKWSKKLRDKTNSFLDSLKTAPISFVGSKIPSGFAWKKKEVQPYIAPKSSKRYVEPKREYSKILGRPTYPENLIGDTTYGAVAASMVSAEDADLRDRVAIQTKKKLCLFEGDVARIALYYAAKKSEVGSLTGEHLQERDRVNKSEALAKAKNVKVAKTTKNKHIFPKGAKQRRQEARGKRRLVEAAIASETEACAEGEETDEASPAVDVEAKTSLEVTPPPVPAPDINEAQTLMHAPFLEEVCAIKGTDCKGYVIDAIDSRKISVAMSEYRIPLLQFAGCWNSTPLGAGSLPFAKHFGIHIRDGSFKTIKLPTSLVNELMTHWVGVSREATFSHYAVTVIRARYLLRFVNNMTSAEIVDAVRYAPALAYMMSWRAEQNINRVVKRVYFTRKQLDCLAALVAGVSLAVVSLSSVFLSTVLAPLGVIGLCSAALLWFIKGKKAERKDHVTKMQAGGVEYEEHSVPSRLTKFMRRVLPQWDKPKEKSKPVIHLVGVATNSHIPTAFANTIGNEQEAIEKRIYVEDIPVVNSVASEFVAFVGNNMEELAAPQVAIQEMNPAAWIEGCGARPEAKARYRLALMRLRLQGINSRSHLPKGLRKLYSRRKLFIKEELLNGQGNLGDAGKAPRHIQGPSDEMMVLVGPWIAALQGYLKKFWSPEHDKNVLWTAGLDSCVSAAFITPGPDQICYDKDFGKFDARQKKAMHEAEKLLLEFFRAPLAVRQLHASSAHCWGVSANGWKYIIEYQRKSGDTWTSLFNTFLNKSMSAFAWTKASRLPYERVKTQYKELVNGDDGAGCMPAEWDVEYYKYIHRSLGMDLEMNVSRHPGDIEFCSMRMVPSAQGPTFSPLAGKLLTKIPWTLKEPDNAFSHFKGVLLSVQAMCQVAPPLRAYVEILLERLGHVQAVMPADERHKMVGRPCDATPETWHEFERLYGWTLDHQNRWEAFLRSSDIPSCVDNVEFDLLCDHDCMSGSKYTPYVRENYRNPAPKIVLVGEVAGVRAVEADAHNGEQHAANGNTSGRVPGRLLREEPVIVNRVTPWFDNGIVSNSEGVQVVFDTDYNARFTVSTAPPTTFGLANNTSDFCQISIDTAQQNFLVTVQDVVYTIPVYGFRIFNPEPSWVDMPTYIAHFGDDRNVALRHNAAMHALNGNRDAVDEMIIDLEMVQQIDDMFALHDEVANGDDMVFRLPEDALDAWINDPMWLEPIWHQGYPGAEPSYTGSATSAEAMAEQWNELMHALNGNTSVQNGMQITQEHTVMMERARKARRASTYTTLTRLGKFFKCSDSDIRFVIMAVDPFHHEKVNLAGLPDGTASEVVIQVVNQVMFVNAPGGVSGNWDTSIVMWPMLGNLATGYSSQQFVQGTTSGNGGDGWIQTNGGGGACWGITSLSTASGVPISYVTVPSTNTLTQINIPLKYVNSTMRVISAAFEVYNTTAPIYKSGTLIAWRLPSPDLTAGTSTLMTTPGAAATGWISAQRAPAPPNSSQAAAQIATSRAWDAEKGLYSPSILTDIENTPSTANVTGTFLYYDVAPTDSTVVGHTPLMLSSNILYPRNNNWTGMELSGAYVSGLTPQSTLMVSGRWILETRPSTNDSLITTARDSFPYSPGCLALYSAVMSRMPAGVPVCENDLGELFADAVEWVATQVGNVGLVLGQPKLIAGAQIAKEAVRAGRQTRATVDKAVKFAKSIARNNQKGKGKAAK